MLLLLQDWLLDDPCSLLSADNMLSYQLHYHWVAAAVHLGQEGKAGEEKRETIPKEKEFQWQEQ